MGFLNDFVKPSSVRRREVNNPGTDASRVKRRDKCKNKHCHNQADPDDNIHGLCPSCMKIHG
jgi:hypothetical protein